MQKSNKKIKINTLQDLIKFNEELNIEYESRFYEAVKDVKLYYIPSRLKWNEDYQMLLYYVTEIPRHLTYGELNSYDLITSENSFDICLDSYKEVSKIYFDKYEANRVCETRNNNLIKKEIEMLENNIESFNVDFYLNRLYNKLEENKKRLFKLKNLVLKK